MTTLPIPTIADSGERRTFASGAVRDRAAGKGRCDLLPFEVAARLLDSGSEIFRALAAFRETQETHYLINALTLFADIAYGGSVETMILEVSKHFEEGSRKYEEDNWRKGIPPKDYLDSMTRHLLKWLRGDEDEPHGRAFVWNAMCCIWEVDYHNTVAKGA